MATESRPYDAVAAMRKIRDNLSRRFKGLSFAEQKREMAVLAKRRSRRIEKPRRHS